MTAQPILSGQDAKPMKDAASVFISYSRKDIAFVDRLQAALEARGINAAVDREAIAKGEEWWTRIRQLIEEADTIVFVLSPDSVASAVCQDEVDYAETLNKRFVPVVARDVAGFEVPTQLSRLNYIHFIEMPAVGATGDFDTAANELADAISTDIGWIREHTRIGVLANRWIARDRNTALLLRGAELQAAESWIAAQPARAPTPTAAHQALIVESHKAAARRQRNWLAGALAAVLIASSLAVWSEVNRRIAVAERNRVERVLERTTEATKQLVLDIANRYAPRRGIPRDMIIAILSQARKLVSELESVGEKRPTLLLNGGLALAELSAAMRAQGEDAAALETAEATVAVFRKLRAVAPADAGWQSGLVVGLDRLGDIRFDLGQHDAARIAYDEGLQIARALPASDARSRQIAAALENVGHSDEAAGRLDAAKASYETALETWQVLPDNDADVERLRAIAATLERIGDVAARTGDGAAALAAYRDSLARTQALAARDENNTDWQQDLGTAHNKLGDMLLAAGDGAGALEQYEAHLAIAGRLHESDPAWRPWRHALMIAGERMGNAAYTLGAGVRALTAFEAALAHARELAGTATVAGGGLDDLSRLMRSTTLAAADVNGNGDAAGRAQSMVEDFRQIASASGAGDVAGYEAPLLSDAAWFQLLNGEFGKALVSSREAAALAPDAVLYQSNLAHALMFAGETDKARDIYLAHMDAETIGGMNWQAYIASDFKALREAGYTHPLMDEIETAFR
ncbi:MAG: toll/interleukin-1 receptor domain-containing protein [Novosphingobium sp.]|nr:toll/interleukin-1 receptor domain-containing protein [Novosphingobium sp.]